jgi:hypothetical protein
MATLDAVTGQLTNQRPVTFVSALESGGNQRLVLQVFTQ